MIYDDLFDILLIVFSTKKMSPLCEAIRIFVCVIPHLTVIPICLISELQNYSDDQLDYIMNRHHGWDDRQILKSFAMLTCVTKED